jgi:hypothetical protein
MSTILERRKTEDRRRKSEDGRQKTEDGRQKTEDGRQKTEDGSKKPGKRQAGQKSEDLIVGEEVERMK